MSPHRVSVQLHARADLSNSLGQQLDEVLSYVLPILGGEYTIAVNVAASNNFGLFRFSLDETTRTFTGQPVVEEASQETSETADAATSGSIESTPDTDSSELAKSISDLLCLTRKTRLDKKQRSVRERMVSILEREGITSVGELTALSLDELKALPGIGPATYGVLIEKLQKRGLSLREDS